MSKNIKPVSKNSNTFAETIYLIERMDNKHGAALLQEVVKTLTPQTSDIIIYSSIYCPVDLITQAAEQILLKENLTSTELEILAYISSNPSTPAKILTKIAKHKNIAFKTLIAQNPSTPEKLLDVLAKDKSWEVKQQVAFNNATSQQTINKLLDDKDSNVRQTALAHPKTDAETLIKVLGANPDMLQIRAASRNPNLPKSLALKFAQHHSPTVKAAIAANPSTPAEILYMLQANENTTVQAGIASNINIPEELSLILSNPVHDLNVRANLADNPNISAQAATMLLVDPVPMVRRRTALIQRTLSPSALAQAGLEEEDPRVLAAITTHPKMPTNIATQIVAKTLTKKELSFSKSLIRAIVYSESSVQPGIAYLIAGIDDPKSLAILATRSDCPLAIFTASAKHENPALRRAAAANSECPPHLLHKLSMDSDSLTSILAKTHPNYSELSNI